MELSHDDKLLLEQIKLALKPTNYFVVNMLASHKPALLLYRKDTPSNVYVAKSSNLKLFTTTLKKVVGIKKETIDGFRSAAEAKLAGMPGGDSSLEPKQTKKPYSPPGGYWWQNT